MRLKFALVLFFLPSLVLSQGSSHGAASLKLPTTSFVAATSESFIADPASIQSVLINPANLASNKSYGIIFSHTEWIQDTRTEFLSIVAPFNFGPISLSIANTSIDGLELRELPGPAIGTFNVQSTFIQLNYGVELTETIQLGIAPKYLYEKIFVDEATGYGFDAGILYTPQFDGFILGCSLTDIGSLSAFQKEKTDLPSQIRLGGTYSFSLNEFSFRMATAFSSELGMSTNHLSIGCETIYQNTITARLGYKTGYISRGFSAGIGLRYNIVAIDYAYTPFSMQLGNAHIISVGFIL